MSFCVVWKPVSEDVCLVIIDDNKTDIFWSTMTFSYLH